MGQLCAHPGRLQTKRAIHRLPDGELLLPSRAMVCVCICVFVCVCVGVGVCCLMEHFRELLVCVHYCVHEGVLCTCRRMQASSSYFVMQPYV